MGIGPEVDTAADKGSLMENSIAFEIAQRALDGKSKIPVYQRRNEEIIRRELSLLFQLSARVGRDLFPCKCELEIEYQREFQEPETRQITAESVFMFSRQAYLEAFCHYRQKRRTFKLDRMLSTRVVGESKYVSYPLTVLEVSDFFVHPKTWGDYRRPCSILVRKMMDVSVPKAERFRFIFEFAARSLSRGVWADSFTDGKAAGVAFLALNTDVINFNWQAEVGRIRGGRFDQAAFTETLKSIDHFGLRGRFRPINGADPSSV
ncbi:MAG: WYL domain-containing protein [Erythrobacter sp.]|jgi:hypothetical protein|nr:WYL domain-containing protein [Erythrobacter sp.]QDH34038.1 WYL domain-containing protein [Porphyrobacter sp. YT40]